jgi:hypothetical protein
MPYLRHCNSALLSVLISVLLFIVNIMESIEKIKENIGPQIIKIFLDEIKWGRLDINNIQMIGIKMNGSVNSVFRQKKDTLEPALLMRHMIERWNKEVLSIPKDGKLPDGYQLLIDILESEFVDCAWLAEEMKTVKMKSSNQC